MSLSLSDVHAASPKVVSHPLLSHLNKSLEKKKGAHSFQELDRFYLPDIRLKQVTLDEAFKAIDVAYKETCEITLQKPLQIKYTGAPTEKRTLNITLSGTYQETTKLIAAYFGSELRYSPDTQTVAVSPTTIDPSITQSEIPLPPDWYQLLNLTPSTKDRTNASEEKALEKLASILDENNKTEISYSRKKCTMTISGSPLAVKKLKNISQILRGIKPSQIRVASKSVALPEKNDPLSRALTGDNVLYLEDGAVQMIMRGLSQTKDTQITTAPSIVMRDKELATLELINEFESGLLSKKKQWTGCRLHIYGELTGFDITLNRETFIGQREGLLNKFHYYDYKWITTCRDGNTTARYSHSHNGLNYYIFMTNNIVDATGKRVRVTKS
ncbi:hypothetical protein [Rubritalea sp.]|uniref:hypothetical protein n=1 Tax=Rubritalea sp. TaxID=2109375 RepID=UPI003EF3B406